MRSLSMSVTFSISAFRKVTRNKYQQRERKMGEPYGWPYGYPNAHQRRLTCSTAMLRYRTLELKSITQILPFYYDSPTVALYAPALIVKRGFGYRLRRRNNVEGS
jgi:hypothetical protein